METFKEIGLAIIGGTLVWVVTKEYSYAYMSFIIILFSRG